MRNGGGPQDFLTSHQHHIKSLSENLAPSPPAPLPRRGEGSIWIGSKSHTALRSAILNGHGKATIQPEVTRMAHRVLRRDRLAVHAPAGVEMAVGRKRYRL